jgi:nitroreductase
MTPPPPPPPPPPLPPDAAALHEFFRTRRSVRAFAARPVDRAVLERLVAAAITAPSSTNRQPWRFTVVTAPERRRAIAAAVRARGDEMKAIIQRGHHADDFGNYGDFFHEPLENAAAIIVPQYREYPDLIAAFIASGGGDPARFTTSAAMQAELCSTSAAVMVLLLAAHAEGLGACWMAGPMIARDDVSRLCEIHEPWRMLGAVAVGHLAPDAAAAGSSPKPARKPLDRVIDFIE